VKRVADVVLGVGVVERPGQDVRIVRTGGLDDRQETARRLEDLDPAVITDDAVSADDDRSPVPDRDAGVLQAEFDDLVELVVTEAVPRTTKRGVDREKRLAVGPEPADVHPRASHRFSIAVDATS
jgi:hypothetical protein